MPDRQTDRHLATAQSALWIRIAQKKSSERLLSLFIFAVVWAVCGQPQPGYESTLLLLLSVFNDESPIPCQEAS